MNRRLSADSVRSGDVSKMIALIAVIAMIVGLGYWAFKWQGNKAGRTAPAESAGAATPKSSNSLSRWTAPLV